MSKKTFGTQLRATIASEDSALQKRFEKADAILLQRPSTASDKELTTSKVIRDTFTMPPNDYALIEQHRTRAARLGHIATKSDVIRAGLTALKVLNDEQLLDTLKVLERILPGRKTR